MGATAVQVYPGLQVVTTVLRGVTVLGGFFHDSEKVTC